MTSKLWWSVFDGVQAGNRVIPQTRGQLTADLAALDHRRELGKARPDHLFAVHAPEVGVGRELTKVSSFLRVPPTSTGSANRGRVST